MPDRTKNGQTEKGSSSENTDKTQGRRKLLKLLSASGSLVVGSNLVPDEWSRPVVQSVITPAHAGTSPDGTPTPTPTTTSTSTDTPTTDTPTTDTPTTDSPV